MRILVFGAGVMGSLYAAKLKQAGLDVTILARGERAKQLKTEGIIWEDPFNHRQTTFHIPIIEKINSEDEFDLVAIHVRANQLKDVIPILAKNENFKTILLMLNYPAGVKEVAEKLGPDRVVVGFPGGGGWIDEKGVLQASLAPGFAQPTTFGLVDGGSNTKLKEVIRLYSQAGFPTAFTKNIDAWLKTHVAWTLPLECILYKHNFNQKAAAAEAKVVTQAIKEGLLVLKALGLPLLPTQIKFIFDQLPEFMAESIVAWWLKSKNGEVFTLKHAQNAPDEAKFLAGQFKELINRSKIKTPILEKLYSYLP